MHRGRLYARVPVPSLHGGRRGAHVEPDERSAARVLHPGSLFHAVFGVERVH